MSESPVFIEKRKEPRFSLRVPLYVATGEGVLRKMVLIESRDISAGGLSFDTGRELPLRAKSVIVLSRPGDPLNTVLVRGIVAWTQESAGTGRFRVGVEFTDYDGLTRQELVAKMEGWAAS
jgi:c-di-GMP-binding flagellar brake protein YcgR